MKGRIIIFENDLALIFLIELKIFFRKKMI